MKKINFLIIVFFSFVVFLMLFLIYNLLVKKETEIYFQPPNIEKYYDTRGEFISRLAKKERTSFYPNVNDGVLDAPNIEAADNPSVFLHDDKLYFIFGDPIKDGPAEEAIALTGAMAFTEEIVPEKDISLHHLRNWIYDPQGEDNDSNGYPDAKSIAFFDDLFPNNVGGAIVELPNGEKRIWFGTYGYGEGGAPFARRTGFRFSDDNFETLAMQNPNLITWDEKDENNGNLKPDPFLGYSMRVYKDYLYVMMPRRHLIEQYTDIILLRTKLDNLKKDAQQLTLNDWEYLISVNETDGKATWGKNLARGQISHDLENFPQTFIPPVKFEPSNRKPYIISSITWNPYMNRWIAVDTLEAKVYESDYFWGPYKLVFGVSHPISTYNFFTNEVLLSDNGKNIYYARSDWPFQDYGTFLFKTEVKDKLVLNLSKKSAIRGDEIDIFVRDNTGLNIPANNLQVIFGEEGNAYYVRSIGNTHVFRYMMTGNENRGEIGVVKVKARASIENKVYERDASIVVNQINNIKCSIDFPKNNTEVSGTVFLRANFVYEKSPENLGEGRPEVYIIKSELRWLGPDGEIVEDADIKTPYKLRLDTTRFENGLKTFKVVGYDTLDRRCESTISLRINNQKPQVLGNLIRDGDMERVDTAEWRVFNNESNETRIMKIADGRHRNGDRSLLIIKDRFLRSSGGVEQHIENLLGGENLRFTAWVNLKSYVEYGEFTRSFVYWEIILENGSIISSGSANPNGFFRKIKSEFQNPLGNRKLTVRIRIGDNNDNAPKVEAIVDDVVLRRTNYEEIEAPQEVTVFNNGTANIVQWKKLNDRNVEYYYIYRKDPGNLEYQKIDETKFYNDIFYDSNLGSGNPTSFSYRVVATDFMALKSKMSSDAIPVIDSDGDNVADLYDIEATNNFVCGDRDLDGCDDCSKKGKWDANDDGLDSDADGICNLADGDNDNDGIINEIDNCPLVYNPDQRDSDRDGLGDVCDTSNDNRSDNRSNGGRGGNGGGGGGYGGGGNNNNLSNNCTPNWRCTDWSDCVGGKQNRICFDANNCNQSARERNETRRCGVPPPENESDTNQTDNETEEDNLENKRKNIFDFLAEKTRLKTILIFITIYSIIILCISIIVYFLRSKNKK